MDNTSLAENSEAISIASELIRARTERGFSQSQLSEQSGVSRSAIKAYETGRNMPGSRELRALCVALKVTPNMLLFGTEAPTFDTGAGGQLDALLRADPEDKALHRTRLTVLSELLTNDEAAALFLLAKSLAIARHGPERAEQAMQRADLFVVLQREMMEAAKSGQLPDPARLESGMGRLGHKSKR